MIQKLKTKLIILSSLIFLAAPVAFAGVASATAPVSPDTGVCSGASNLQIGTGDNNAPASGSCTGVDETSKVNNLITTIINVFSVVVGIVAVIMIIVGGFRYITSGGDSTKVTSAKNTILYAIIGLVIVALAQIIVKFVLNKTVTS